MKIREKHSSKPKEERKQLTLFWSSRKWESELNEDRLAGAHVRQRNRTSRNEVLVSLLVVHDLQEERIY